MQEAPETALMMAWRAELGRLVCAPVVEEARRSCGVLCLRIKVELSIEPSFFILQCSSYAHDSGLLFVEISPCAWKSSGGYSRAV